MDNELYEAIIQQANIIDVISQFSLSQWESFGNLVTEHTGLIDAIATSVRHINNLNQFILGINISEAPGWKISWALLIPISAVRIM